MGGKQNNWTTGMGVNCIMANEITTPMEPAGRVLPLFRGEYSDSIVYENPDIVLYENSSYVAKQITIGNPPPKNASSNDYWQMIAKGIIDADISESTVEFTEASERSNIKNGEKTNIIMGKIMKFFADLKDVAFSGSYVDLSNKPTIPASAKNGKLTIQINGIEVQTFTANQSTNAVANILVPTISNSAAVTQTGQMALDAVEKNAAVPGTLAHQVQQVNSNISEQIYDFETSTFLNNITYVTRLSEWYPKNKIYKIGRICWMSLGIKTKNVTENDKVLNVAAIPDAFAPIAVVSKRSSDYTVGIYPGNNLLYASERDVTKFPNWSDVAGEGKEEFIEFNFVYFSKI